MAEKTESETKDVVVKQDPKTGQFLPGVRQNNGRPKGKQNKSTVQLKKAIMNAFEKVGGEDYLVVVARKDPKTFCTLLGRVLPAELNAKVEANIGITVADDEMEL